MADGRPPPQRPRSVSVQEVSSPVHRTKLPSRSPAQPARTQSMRLPRMPSMSPEPFHRRSCTSASLFSDLPERDGAVKVYIRVRPFLAREKVDAANYKSAVMVSGSHIHVVDTKTTSVRVSYPVREDGVLWSVPPEETEATLVQPGQETPPFWCQQRVFDHCGAPAVTSVLQGYNTCIFAYGNTGSGKTYTMMGPPAHAVKAPEEVGLIPRTIRDLFERADGQDVFISVSFMEIYMENVRDLVTPSKENLKVRSDPVAGFVAEDLTVKRVSTLTEVLSLVEKGDRERHTAHTRSNDRSSRSHALLTIHVKQARFEAQLNLVDLAGNEKSDTQGVLFEESVKINLSLTTLGRVIDALSAGDEHVPTRDSQLTKLLSNCLGGNSRTSMIATVSPSPECIDFTASTLRYASRACGIVNVPVVNESSELGRIRALEARAEQYRREAAAWKKRAELACSAQGERQDVESDLCQQISVMHKERSTLADRNSRLTERNKQLAKSANTFTQKRDELERRCQMLERANEALEMQLKKRPQAPPPAPAKKRATQGRTEPSEPRPGGGGARDDKKDAEEARLQSRVVQLESELSRERTRAQAADRVTQRKIKGQDDRIQELLTRNAELTQDGHRQRSELGAAERARREAVDAEVQRRLSIEKENATLGEINRRMRDAASKTERTLDETKALHRKLVDENDKLRAKLQAETTAHRAQQDRLAKDLLAADAQVAEVRKRASGDECREMAELKETLRRRDSELAAAREQLAGMAEVKEALRLRDSELAAARDQLAERSEEARQLQSQCEAVNAAEQSNRDRLQNLSSQLQAMGTQQSAAEEERSELARAKRAADSAAADARRQLEQTAARLKLAERSVAQLQEERRGLTSDVEAARRSEEELQRTCSRSVTQLEELREDLRQSEARATERLGHEQHLRQSEALATERLQADMRQRLLSEHEQSLLQSEARASERLAELREDLQQSEARSAEQVEQLRADLRQSQARAVGLAEATAARERELESQLEAAQQQLQVAIDSAAGVRHELETERRAADEAAIGRDELQQRLRAAAEQTTAVREEMAEGLRAAVDQTSEAWAERLNVQLERQAQDWRQRVDAAERRADHTGDRALETMRSVVGFLRAADKQRAAEQRSRRSVEQMEAEVRLSAICEFYTPCRSLQLEGDRVDLVSKTLEASEWRECFLGRRRQAECDEDTVLSDAESEDAAPHSLAAQLVQAAGAARSKVFAAMRWPRPEAPSAAPPSPPKMPIELRRPPLSPVVAFGNGSSAGSRKGPRRLSLVMSPRSEGMASPYRQYDRDSSGPRSQQAPA